MPYKSDAQRKKFHALAAEGKMKPEVVAEFDKASKGKKLPERITPKKITSIKDIRDKIKK
jgi:hypothetical protein